MTRTAILVAGEAIAFGIASVIHAGLLMAAHERGKAGTAEGIMRSCWRSAGSTIGAYVSACHLRL